jgi:hypothetical protein
VVLAGRGRTVEFMRDGISPDQGMKVEFSVVKSRCLDPNTCNLKIWGLDPQLRALAISRRPATVIRLYAGYAEDGARHLYTGRVLWGMMERNGPDWVVSLESLGGSTGHPIAAKFPAGAKYEEVLKGITSLIPGDDGQKGTTATGQVKPAGLSSRARVFVGTARKALEVLSDESKMATSIQDGKLYSTPGVEPTDEAPIILHADSGMEGSPTVTKAGFGNMIFHAPGIEVTMRLRPDLGVGRRLKVYSQIFGGSAENPGSVNVYAVKVSHNGDTRGAAWSTKVEAYFTR